jgi:hypothetical protein
MPPPVPGTVTAMLISVHDLCLRPEDTLLTQIVDTFPKNATTFRARQGLSNPRSLFDDLIIYDRTEGAIAKCTQGPQSRHGPYFEKVHSAKGKFQSHPPDVTGHSPKYSDIHQYRQTNVPKYRGGEIDEIQITHEYEYP